MQAGSSTSQSRTTNEVASKCVQDNGDTFNETFEKISVSDNESSEDDDMCHASAMESDTSFLDHSSTIQLNIWVPNKSFLESSDICELFDNIQADSKGVPQFRKSNKYFDIAQGTIYYQSATMTVPFFR